MVDGVHMVFSKEKMIERLEKEGLSDKITDDIVAIMDNLDGQEVGSNSWNRQVYGHPVYTCKGKDGKDYDVNENDCMGLYEYKQSKSYNKGNDCDACENMYFYGSDDDCYGCKCSDEGKECNFIQAE